MALYRTARDLEATLRSAVPANEPVAQATVTYTPLRG
jgi:hypothetical protein